MARSATLNPASMPFFPSSGPRTPSLSGDDDGPTFSGAHAAAHTNGSVGDRASIASSSGLSMSPSEYRSVKSSPSPPRSVHTQEPPERARNSPTIRLPDAPRTFPNIESRMHREGSLLGGSNLESLPEAEDVVHTPGASRDQQSLFNFSPPAQMSRASIPNNILNGSSPPSSIGSISHLSSSNEPHSKSFEGQLKASPLMHDLLDRLIRCEFTTREVQKELGDLHRKVNILIDRSLSNNHVGAGAGSSGGMNSMSQQPEFNDPFSSSGGAAPAGRPSMPSIAPNQVAPSDDVGSISQRLNTLTSSVGQLLALQTQQLHSSTNQSFIGGPGGPQLDGLPAPQPPSGLPPNMIPHRPSPRVPNPPLRTWSTGTLDLPVRPPQADTLGRNQRRSVSGLLNNRRDSSGMIDNLNDSRDSGPVVSKWEQLNLHQDLLRSLNKFGIGPPNKIQQRALPFLLRGADIIAQAPPTQERIAAYVIPAIQTVITHMTARPNRGPLVIMVSTTVDQATQAQRMIRDLGTPIGIRSALGVGVANGDLSHELRMLQQSIPHIICGTPQKLHALFTSPGGLVGSEVRFLVLDEVDQLIARNLHEFVFNIVKLLPAPRNRPLAPGAPGASTPSTESNSPFAAPGARRFSSTLVPGANSSPALDSGSTTPVPIERQTALFSNTVPQDVLNLATSIQLREPVRVLVRRDGNVTQADSVQGARGLRQFYLYLAFTAGAGRSADAASTASTGGSMGIIGSGRGAAPTAESQQAREWKLDALADLLDDVDVSHAIVHVGGTNALDQVVYKLASRGLEAIPLHSDMASPTKLAALTKYRSNSVMMRQPSTKVLVVYDVQIKDVPQVPLIVNYDLPKAVEEYAHRVAPAIAASNYSKAGVVVNFVTATGGDVEMLRSIECFYKIKCPEVPMSLRDVV